MITLALADIRALRFKQAFRHHGFGGVGLCIVSARGGFHAEGPLAQVAALSGFVRLSPNWIPASA